MGHGGQAVSFVLEDSKKGSNSTTCFVVRSSGKRNAWRGVITVVIESWVEHGIRFRYGMVGVGDIEVDEMKGKKR